MVATGKDSIGKESIVKDSINNNTPQKRFVKPTLEEVQAYCAERNNGVDAQRWYDYYESNGWKVGRNPMKDYKAAIRNWERKEGVKNGGNAKYERHTDYDKYTD